MKKWTVMLIPHDPGQTRTFTLNNWHSRSLLVFCCALTFTTACLYQWNHQIRVRSDQLAQENWMLQVRQGAAVSSAPTENPENAGDKVRDAEERLRAQYESSLAAITAELGDLYNMEAKFRAISNLAPRSSKAMEKIPKTITNGKGGPPEESAPVAQPLNSAPLHLPNVIYGVSRPSADLISQEIRLRTRSLRELVLFMEAQRDSVDRFPSVWPLAGGAGRRTSSFGYRRDPFHGRISQHAGIDISAAIGTKILTTAKGTVEESRQDPWYGNMVVIDHGNGLHTLYAHMTQRLVREGQKVNRKDPIGTVGSTGRSTGPHLHYEVHQGKTPVNPDKYLTE